MKRAALIVLALFVVACSKPEAHAFGVAVPGPANPFVPVDPSGNYPASISVSGSTSDGGFTNVDPVPAAETNTLVVQPVPATQQVLIDAGTRCVLGVAWTNESATGGYGQIYCGQYALDAGGTAAAGTAPNLQLRCPAGQICSISLQAPLCCAGANWYSSVDAGYLVTSSTPSMTLTAAALR